MNKSPLVSLLLLNCNGIEYTKKCIRSLLKTTYTPFEIVVVDNGSLIDEAGALEKLFGSSIRVIRLKENKGYAVGMNVAILHAKGQYIAILNNDMDFDSRWLTPLVEILKKNPDVGACQPKIRDVMRRTYFEYSVAGGGFIDILGYPFARGRIFSDIEKDDGQYDTTIKVCWTGVFLTRKKVLQEVGVFDPIYVNYGEDMDLCMRIYYAGYMIVNVPSSVVYHVGGALLKKNIRKKMFFHHRNNLIFLLLHWPTRLLIAVIIPRILLDIVSSLYYLFYGFYDGTIAVYQAYGSLFGMLGQVIRNRMKLTKKLRHKKYETVPLYRGSIVWDYFILRKQKFSSIMKPESLTALKL